MNSSSKVPLWMGAASGPGTATPGQGGGAWAIPDHELIKPIGKGAYGEVWLARNVLGEWRAVKVVWRREFGQDDRPFEREFEGIQQFEPISRSHPSQLAILHVGRNEAAGFFYYVMELADAVNEPGSTATSSDKTEKPAPKTPSLVLTGSTLDSTKLRPEDYHPRTLRFEFKQHGRLRVDRVVEIGLSLATALEHLHAHGLVHRDVKPSNIIFVAGRPKLADIGLVTNMAGNDDTRSIVGTEGYLAPEGPGTPQADLFALGKVLYEAATGLDRRRFPQLPPDLRTRPDAGAFLGLNEILLKAAAHDWHKRYQSAAEMSADLELLSEGKPTRHVEKGKSLLHGRRRIIAWGGGVAIVTTVLWAGSHRGHQQPVTGLERLSSDPVANRLFDRGRLFFEQTTGTGFAKSADYLEQAIRVDPNFAQAYASLCLTYTWSIDGWSGNCWSNLPRARTIAMRALDLDQNLPEPHLALGMYKVMREWAWADAEREFQRALAINHSKPVFNYFYAEYLRMRGRTNEALTEMTKAFNLDRLSACSNVRLADFLIAARRYEDALTQSDQAIAMEPFAHSYGWLFRIRALTALNRYREAIDSEQEQRKRWGENAAKVDSDIQNLRKEAESDASTAYWRDQLSRTDSEGFYWKARAYSQLREPEQAIQNLKQACDSRDVWLTFYVMTDWTLDPLRNDIRFHEILKRMHLE